jgi:uncharacterized membrane protein (TIGR02234 family)
MNGRGSPAAAVVSCAVGGLLILLASGRRWAHVTLTDPTAGGQSHLAVTGHAVAPALPALGIALLALAAAILAAKGMLRRVVGLLIVLVAGAAVGVAVTAPGDVSSALEHHEVGAQGLAVHASANGWWVIAAIGGVLAVVAGLLTVLRADQWSGLGSKYDAPSAPKPTKDPAVLAWDALDRGEDPTA